jgi:cell division septal protein FtsQ
VNRKAPVRRRFRVVARPQARARRARLFGAACAVLILGAVAAATARHAVVALLRSGFSLPSVSSSAPESALVDGAPEPLRSLLQEAADAAGGSAGEKAAALKTKFPCVADVTVRRAWGEKRSTLTPTLRRAQAPALRLGRPAGFLSDDGVVFAAPDGAYALAGPSVDVAGAGDADLKALAREWPALSAPGAFPAPLSEMAYVSAAGDGWWEARLTDGTDVAWGRLDWTKEKLARLAEALADARAKTPGSFSADLRYFEDGKVLLKPSGTALAAAGHGGVR